MESGVGGSMLSLATDLVEAYASVFVHCWSQYAVQQRDGSYWRVREPLTLPLIAAHLLGVELYPKQDVLGPDGACSLIRLPLGIHRQARGWFPFVQVHEEGDVVPVGETVWECCTWVSQHVQRVAVPAAVQVECAALSLPPVRDRPLMASHVALSHLGRDSIRAWCRAQDLVAVIGRYVALDRRGVGSCPFKEHHYRGDQRPSFQVFHDHWYCYTWGRAGDLCDFLCLYYNLSTQEVWQRVRAGWQP